MTFTDDKVKRLKDETKAHWEWMKPLLARLEAAEAVIERAKRMEFEDGLIMYDLNMTTPRSTELMEAWRKVAGK